VEKSKFDEQKIELGIHEKWNRLELFLSKRRVAPRRIVSAPGIGGFVEEIRADFSREVPSPRFQARKEGIAASMIRLTV
jgi:hypothetical protein